MDATGAKAKAVAKNAQTTKKASSKKKPTSTSSKSKKGSQKKSSKYSKSKKQLEWIECRLYLLGEQFTNPICKCFFSK